MNIIIVRHAEPNYAIDSLTRKGKREAKLLSKKLSQIDAVSYYCSPLGRAKKTSSYTMKLLKKKPEILPWLEEFEGKIILNGERTHCWDLMPSLWTAIPEMYTDEWINTDIMKSDNVPEKYSRVCKGLDEILAKHGYFHEGKLFRVEKENHDTIMLFCHFGVESVILAHLFGVSPVPLWHNTVALPSSVTVVTTEEREKGIASFRMSSFGDLSHLYAGNEKPSFMARFCECFSDDTRH